MEIHVTRLNIISIPLARLNLVVLYVDEEDQDGFYC